MNLLKAANNPSQFLILHKTQAIQQIQTIAFFLDQHLDLLNHR